MACSVIKMVDRLPGEEGDETNWQLRIVLALSALIGIVLTFAVVYRLAFLHVADEDISLIQSAQVVLEILTTAGFGGDTATWREHDALAAMVILMNLSGVLLVFLAIPLFAVPAFREAFGTEPPTESTLTDHVVICGHSAMDDVLREELENAEVPYLFVDSDPQTVQSLNEKGFEAILGNAERVETLRNANLQEARAIVADLDDETNPTVILSADRVNPDVKIISVVQNRDAIPHNRFAGADEVVVSKQSIGESLAMRSMKSVSERFQEAVDSSSRVEFAEYLVEEGSELTGKTIQDVSAFDELGMTIIGGWFGPRFLISPPPDTVIVENTILLVSGGDNGLEELGTRRLPSHQGHPSRVVVFGYGDVGRSVTNTLESEGIDVTVVDLKQRGRVDTIGDVTEMKTIREANLENARAVVLALDTDVPAIYGSILINQAYPDVEIITRANDPENVWKLYNAGADYVLSLPAVTGEVLAATLIHDQEILTPRDDFEFVRTEAPALEGQTLSEAHIRNKTGCTVVSVERNGELVMDLGPNFTIEAGDVLIGLGGETAIERFRLLANGEAEFADTEE